MSYLPFHITGLATSAGGRDSGRGDLEEWLSERARRERICIQPVRRGLGWQERRGQR